MRSGSSLRAALLVVLALGAGCRTRLMPDDSAIDLASRPVVDGAAPDGPATPDAAVLDLGLCAVTSQSNLPGVTIRFTHPADCTFTLAQAAAGIAIPYTVDVAMDLAGVVPSPQDAGNCGKPGPSGLIVFEQLDGGGQQYCLCGVGFCPMPTMTPVILHAGSYGSAFSWTGRNWMGPSDTSNPMGAPFPVGDYTLHVSAAGHWMSPMGIQPFQVVATLGIALVP